MTLLSKQPHGPADDPPPYSNATDLPPSRSLPPSQPLPLRPAEADASASSSSAAATPAQSGPPSNAQKAKAPLKVIQSNEGIKTSYILLDVESSKTPPDVILKTTNSRITSALWIEGGPPRPVVIEATTTNASIDMSVNVIVPYQSIHLSATTTNASLRVALPRDFHGMLTVFTTNAKHTLSTELQARSVRISLDDPEDERTVGYQIGGPGGESNAVLKTTNSSIKVGLTSDPIDERERGSCVLC